MTQNVMPLLKPGSKVGVAAPARKISRAELDPFLMWCQDMQWEPVLPPHLLGASHQFSGTDEQRAADMNMLLNDPNIQALFMVRGGYGCARIVDQIDWNLLKKYPKWVCGYSDITVFHRMINRQLKMPSLHCFMPVSFLQYNDESFTRSLQLTAGFLKTGSVSYEVPGLNALDLPGSFQITGGNLSVLYSLLGSNLDLNHHGAEVLFIEDLEEYLYHINRMMVALRRAQNLTPFKALFCGSFNKMNDNTIPFGKTAEESIMEQAKLASLPVLTSFPAGHIANNLPIPMGVKTSRSYNTLQFSTL